METKKIEVVCNWPNHLSVPDINVFLRFANFYQQFIQGFTQIASSLIFMLPTTSGFTTKESIFIDRYDGNDSSKILHKPHCT